MNCPTCGRGDESVLEQLLAEERIKRQDAENDLAEKRRKITALKNELDKQRKQNPNAQDARDLFDHWVERLGKNARVVFGEDREKACLKALEHYPVERLKLAVDGLAAFPVDTGYGRHGPREANGVVRDELKYLLAGSARIEKFEKLAGPVSDTGSEWSPARPVRDWAQPLQKVVEAMRLEYGDEAVELRWDRWYWGPCPAHPEGQFEFRVRNLKGQPALEMECIRRCPRAAHLEALGALGAAVPDDAPLTLELAA